MKQILAAIGLMILSGYSCEPTKSTANLTYFEVGFKNKSAEWRDSSFVIATSNSGLIKEARAQLKLPVAKRKHITGELLAGDAGYNKNATHIFKWHLKEDSWQLVEISMELCDGRPYSDVDLNFDYWLNTVKVFCPWNSYIKREIAVRK